MKQILENRDQLQDALERTVPYVQQLEEEVEICRRMLGDEYDDPGSMLDELESHKKAIKGMTKQYNQLERDYEEMKNQ
eukprot:CAMPEP_0168314372 /NCGR_PEP_ID=MMETSP0210-20121227/7445_1 /TAXON_ID=40633 /ORGANISM="Condylostoma magnum, Strain COL2" /LENGTH=77 /DNA_ID=CAMNT_0008281003 /DNA_START=1284 /DNA_END=1517 /DNA_ORIENTATION=+